MKSFNKFLLAGFLTMGLFACSDSNDASGNEQNTENSDAVYMSFKLELPSVAGGRSATDGEGTTNSNANPDYEVGQDEENNVNTALIVLTDNDYDYVAQYTLTGTQLGDATGDVYKTYTVKFESKDLANAMTGTELKVLVFCNPTSTLSSIFAQETPGNVKDAIESLGETAPNGVDASIWTKNAFLMTNTDNSNVISVPNSWEPYYTESNPYDLGVISVERSSARFDFKATNNNSYSVEDATDGSLVGNVVLTDATLINMSKNFYYLRRVSTNGLKANSTVGGVEANNNYVVDTDADEKNGYTAATWNDKADNFFYNLENPESWSWTSLSTIQTEDNWVGNDGNDGYKIWRYAIENTIPGINNQLHGISTGVVFKGNMVFAENAGIDNTRPVYLYMNHIYGNLSHLKAAAEAEDALPSLTVAYESLQKAIDAEIAKLNLAEGTEASADQLNVAEDAVAAAAYDFTRYYPNDGKYEMFYYYWNRHNDNGDKEVMGIMEFAVVRNNVYKLAVTNINKFGHPDPSKDPEKNDPDPVDPDDPDEEKNIYFKVSVKVLPWVVRVNNIEF